MRSFVHGTLKQGFPNFAINTGRRLGGGFRTRRPLLLHVVRLPHEDRAPWLIDGGGLGCPVPGKVFEVDEAALQAMDALEAVGRPPGYQRVAVDLEALDGACADLRAQVYLTQRHQLAECLAIEGLFEAWTATRAVGCRLALPRPLRSRQHRGRHASGASGCP